MSEPNPGKGHHFGAFQLGLLVFTFLVVGVTTVDTLRALPREVSNVIHMIDTFGCAIFFADFCYRFYRAESKLAFMKWGWIDLIACIPNIEILRWGRFVRVLRVIRLLRGVRSVQLLVGAIFHQKLRGGGIALVFGVILLVAFSSISILVCETQADSNIKTAEDAIWWSVTTITTVGYGDKYPVTTEGRAIGFVLMFSGVGLFGVLSGITASIFMGKQEKDTSDAKQVMDRLDRLDAKLDALAERDRN